MIALIDYGMGNLASVRHALHFLGAEAEIVSQGDELAAYDALILPGVGAFDEAMDRLRRTDLAAAIVREVASGKPFLGICLGMQLLFSTSEEGKTAGLDLVPGRVLQLPASPGILIPHIGWNALEECRTALLRAGDYMYFVHSYHVVPDDRSCVVATTQHGARFVSAIQKDNLTAFQFHPEKSGKHGLATLERWLELL